MNTRRFSIIAACVSLAFWAFVPQMYGSYVELSVSGEQCQIHPNGVAISTSSVSGSGCGFNFGLGEGSDSRGLFVELSVHGGITLPADFQGSVSMQAPMEFVETIIPSGTNRQGYIFNPDPPPDVNQVFESGFESLVEVQTFPIPLVDPIPLTDGVPATFHYGATLFLIIGPNATADISYDVVYRIPTPKDINGSPIPGASFIDVTAAPTDLFSPEPQSWVLVMSGAVLACLLKISRVKL